MSVILVEEGGNAEVGDVGEASVVDHDVFGLDVPVYNVFAVNVAYDLEESNYDEFWLNLELLICCSSSVRSLVR
jgi:hypothetical protein